ncbi:hypothetical protein LTR84_001418 [Exophiala bonariae]|uniref:Nephrocystin 3-like N-terminal domain-containing protein n=1 Tax=Exophiala bonariae TaxID=1690606 RepID=A0AAV9NCB4_9EURO|nr:hypothetical protein LTR84_001418 [Exophiala bonariae]
MRRLLPLRRKKHKDKVADVGSPNCSRDASVDKPRIALPSPPTASESNTQVRSVIPTEEIVEGLIEIKGFEDKTRLKRRIDVVAIHGLNGHPYNTWKHDGVIWFSKFLPQHLPGFDLRICTFGYNSRVLGGGSFFRVRDFATQLLESLLSKRSQTDTKDVPLFFICHSLGGVVFKKMLIVAHEREGLYNDIKISTKGVIFFGTPHCGSDIANATRVTRDIFSLCTAKAFRSDLLKSLESNSADLIEIAAQFVERAVPLQILSAYEGRRFGSTIGMVIVDKSSAVLNLPNERLLPIDADHREICRFSDLKDPRFQPVLSAMGQMICESVAMEDNEMKACLDMLYFPAYKERRSNVTDAHINTFEWLWDHPKYKLWENGHSSSLLWLQGKPGSGKSTLANFCRSRVQNRVGLSPKRQTIVVDFFYSVRGGNLQSGHYWMLRSILYQFLLQTPGLWENYRNDFRDCRTTEQSDIWRSQRNNPTDLWSLERSKALLSSLGSLHTPWLKVTAYIIVDALDESEEPNRQEMIQLFRKISQRDLGWPISFKILLTSRPSPKIETVLTNCHKIVLEDETAMDIVNYVDAETGRIAAQILNCKHEELSFISSHLKQASQGVFLWVKLVLQELDERATEGFCSVAELEQLLLTIPTDLKELYQRIQDKIVRGVSKNVRECQTLFRWIAFSPKPLLVEEVLEIIAASACLHPGTTRTELQRNRLRNTEDVRRRLISLCGNLVEVKGRIVQFIHTSVREHLLATHSYGMISVTPANSLFEIANLCLNYVDGFRRELEKDPWLAEQTESPAGHYQGGLAINLDTYIDLINEFGLLRYMFGHEPAFIQLLDNELCSHGGDRNLRLGMSSCSKVLQPLVLEAIAQGNLSALRQLILDSDQINAQYAVPRLDSRFKQDFIHSHFFDETTSSLRLCQIGILCDSSFREDLLELLHSLGADLDGQDSLGRTVVHLSILYEAWASGLLKGVIEESLTLTIKNGFITLGGYAPALLSLPDFRSRVPRRSTAEVFKYSVILSAAIRSNPALMNALPPRGNINSTALISIVRRKPTGPKSISVPHESLVEVVWNLHFAHQRHLAQVFQNSYMITDGLGIVEAKWKLNSANTEVRQSRACIAHLLRLGANVTIESVQSQYTDPVNLSLMYDLGRTTQRLLDNLERNTEYQLSLAKSKTEKSRLLRQFGTTVANYLRRNAYTTGLSPVFDWIDRKCHSDSIFGSLPLDLMDLSREENGCSVMHIAASHGYVDPLRNMIGMGFSECVKDDRGRILMDIALEKRHGRIIAMLLNRRYQGRDRNRRASYEYRARWSWAVRGYLCEGPRLDEAIRHYTTACANPETFHKNPLSESETEFINKISDRRRPVA